MARKREAIKTWAQGRFVDHKRYNHWSKADKANVHFSESLKVTHGLLENAICNCATPHDAKWIAARLNLAAELEQALVSIREAPDSKAEAIEQIKQYCQVRR